MLRLESQPFTTLHVQLSALCRGLSIPVVSQIVWLLMVMIASPTKSQPFTALKSNRRPFACLLSWPLCPGCIAESYSHLGSRPVKCLNPSRSCSPLLGPKHELCIPASPIRSISRPPSCLSSSVVSSLPLSFSLLLLHQVLLIGCA